MCIINQIVCVYKAALFSTWPHTNFDQYVLSRVIMTSHNTNYQRQREKNIQLNYLQSTYNTTKPHNITVNFPQNAHNRHSIAHMWEENTGIFLQFILWFMHYLHHCWTGWDKITSHWTSLHCITLKYQNGSTQSSKTWKYLIRRKTRTFMECLIKVI